MNAASHTHHWTTKSRHRTSEGVVGYQHCACGRWRIHRDSTVQVGQTVAVSAVGSPPERRSESELLIP